MLTISFPSSDQKQKDPESHATNSEPEGCQARELICLGLQRFVGVTTPS